MRASILVIIAALVGSAGACANAELEQKVKDLEDKNAALEPSAAFSCGWPRPRRRRPRRSSASRRPARPSA
jgi:hypothetical protein